MSTNRDFDLTVAKVGAKKVFVAYTDLEEDGKGGSVEVLKTVTRPVAPHPHLIEVWDSFKEYLMRSLGYNDIFDEAMKYLKGDKKQNVVDVYDTIKNAMKITEVEISGKGDLKGCIIKGTTRSFEQQDKSVKTIKILFAGESIGIETNVQGQCELLEAEIHKYLFLNKKGEDQLFDSLKEENGEEEPAFEVGSEALEAV